MKYEKKFREQEQQQKISEVQSGQVAKEFASAEEMLRHDLQQTQVPPEVTLRLNQSLAKESSGRPRSWWQRIFGGNHE